MTICPKHNKELRTGKSGRLFCATPITKDSKGKVVEWCDYNPTNAPADTQPVSLPQAPVTPQKGVETREPVPEDIPFKMRDFDAENRGKCRFGLLVARAENIGIVALTQLEVDEINRQVDFAMTGKFSSLPEDIDDIELPSETVKGV